MARRRSKPKQPKSVETFTHEEATRPNIPSAEHQAVVSDDIAAEIKVAYERRNHDLDPQLVWRGKDEQDLSDLIVSTPPIYIQEKVHPKVLIDDLMRRTEKDQLEKEEQIDLFADAFEEIADGSSTEFYQHDQNWSNRMILGDSLQVMASLAEREGLRGKVQCIYLDPPYGIKFNSNFQWSTTSRDVKDGKVDHITREPEMVKAFRDTWRDGIHSYLTYLRDRLVVARDLLTDSGSIFVQIGDENVHRVRAVMDEVFGEDNFVSEIVISKTSSQTSAFLPSTFDAVIFYAKKKKSLKFRNIFNTKGDAGGDFAEKYTSYWLGFGSYLTSTEATDLQKEKYPCFRLGDTSSQSGGDSTRFEFTHCGRKFFPGSGGWKSNREGFLRLQKADRLYPSRTSLSYVRFLNDFSIVPVGNLWSEISGAVQSRLDPKVYVVQTSTQLIQRCLLMATDPGDLVLDPTCGSGTTATVAEHWGRRWITIDTSRVALAIARARIMGARYPYYLLADSRKGQIKEAELTRSVSPEAPTHGNIRQGFVYERVPHITLKSIANNAEIDVIWDQWQVKLEPLREKLNAALKQNWQEWEIPREANAQWSDVAKKLHDDWWQARIGRQQEIDASIATKADFEYLYDKPYEDKKVVRVAGPFTVESLAPHRALTVDENDELIDGAAIHVAKYETRADFTTIIFDNLKNAGVQQAHKEDKIIFSSLLPWPGRLITAEGLYQEPGAEGNSANTERRAAIFIGPEFGTVARADLVEAAGEAADGGFDVLIACAFNYDAHSSEFNKLGSIPVLKARMNADLHMADDLKNTGKGNLFVIFGEPDVDILDADEQNIQVKINGVDVFHPSTGEVRSDGPEGIACWFVDTDYNEESFFVREAYFLGANDPYKSLKTSLKAEINKEAWSTLNSAVSRPFPKPSGGRIAVKVINHLGDEVMKVFYVE